MKKHLNITKHTYCFGCGVCSASCPKKIINIRLNENGFYEAQIENEACCIDCGICLDICSFSYKELAQRNNPLKSWAAWSNDERVRRKCSSGGIGFEIGKQLIEQGYKAVGCRYNIGNQRAEHFIATSVEEFVQSIGSKYIQSYTEEAFKHIKRKDEKYLIIGTPCQIDSFRRMIEKFHCEKNFILMDFFCHCVPTMHAWRAYMKMLEPKIGKITYASWRNKFDYGWHDSWVMGIDGEKTSKPVNWNESYDLILNEKRTTIQSRMTQGDLFYELFLGDVCLGPQCEKNCKYKYSNSSADIRIGDLWGSTYENDQKGVSALIAFTKKGEAVVENLNNVTLIEHSFDVVAGGQMKENAKHKELTNIVNHMLKHDYSLVGLPFKTIMFAQKIITKLNKILKR